MRELRGVAQAATARVGRDSSRTVASLRSSHVATIRDSATSSGVSDATAPVPSPPRSARAVRSSISCSSPSGPQSTMRPPTSQNASNRPPRGCSASDHPGPRVRGGEHPAQPLQEHRQPAAAAQEPGRPLVALGRGGGGHLLVHVAQQRRAAVARCREEGERLVEAAAVGVGIEVAQAGRRAAAHLAVGRGMLAARELAPAVAQREQRVELLAQLDRERPPAQRPDADPAPGGRRRGHLQDGVGDVQAAAQVDVGVDVLVAHVARRLEAADQAVLQHERAELGARDLEVDGLGLRGPRALGGRRREVRPGARAHVTDLPTYRTWPSALRTR